MFNIFKKQKLSSESKTAVAGKTTYPSIVHEIHNEFLTAGDNILSEAKQILNDRAAKDIEKGNRLSIVGFVNVPEVKTSNGLVMTKELVNLVEYYMVNYPNNKFITEKQVESICLKYGLHCGHISLYKGFVPEKNLLQIESFKIKEADKNVVELINTCIHNISLGWYNEKELPRNNYIIASGRADSKITESILAKAKFLGIPQDAVFVQRRTHSGTPLQICAPLKDMLTDGLKVGTYKIEKKYPDPVVLQPVNGGYLIVTAWGDEASDENIVNETMN